MIPLEQKLHHVIALANDGADRVTNVIAPQRSSRSAFCRTIGGTRTRDDSETAGAQLLEPPRQESAGGVQRTVFIEILCDSLEGTPLRSPLESARSGLSATRRMVHR